MSERRNISEADITREEESIVIVVKFGHFLLCELPVEENQFTHIYCAVKVIHVGKSLSENKPAISEWSAEVFFSLLARNENAILKHLKSFLWSDEVQHQMDPLVVNFGSDLIHVDIGQTHPKAGTSEKFLFTTLRKVISIE